MDPSVLSGVCHPCGFDAMLCIYVELTKVTKVVEVRFRLSQLHDDALRKQVGFQD